MAKKFKPQQSGSYLIEQGTQHGIVAKIEDLGIQAGYEPGDQPRWQYALLFEFPLLRKEGGDEDGKPRGLWITVAQSLNPKSTLGKIVAATGLKVDPLQAFDPDQLVGGNLGVIIGHIEKNGRNYPNAIGYSRLNKDVVPIDPTLMDEELPEFLINRRRQRLDKPKEEVIPGAATSTTSVDEETGEPPSLF